MKGRLRKFRSQSARDRAAVQGEFGDRAILNSDLTPQHVPSGRADWELDFNNFALSYDGYSLWVDVGDFANGVARNWSSSGQLPGDLDSLRACLFFEQRRYHHFGRAPEGKEGGYVWALIDA